ncbi:MAG: CARDB domain-containing protein [archaeon]
MIEATLVPEKLVGMTYNRAWIAAGGAMHVFNKKTSKLESLLLKPEDDFTISTREEASDVVALAGCYEPNMHYSDGKNEYTESTHIPEKKMRGFFKSLKRNHPYMHKALVIGAIVGTLGLAATLGASLAKDVHAENAKKPTAHGRDSPSYSIEDLTNTPDYDENEFDISSDGKIIYRSESPDNPLDSKAYITDINGLGKTQVNTNSLYPSGFAFSPDGRYYAFIYGGESSGPLVGISNSDGSNFAKVNGPNAGWSGHFPVTWNPNGKEIAYEGWAGGVVCISDISGKVTKLTDLPSGAYASAWTPDGKIVFAYEVQEPNGTFKNSLAITNADKTGFQDLYAVFGHSDGIRDLDISKDGEFVVFGDCYNSFGGLLNLNSKSLIKIIQEDYCTLKFSPDGQTIAACTLNYTTNNADALHFINKDGSEIMSINDFDSINYGKWAPDGKTFIVSAAFHDADKGNVYDIYKIDLNLPSTLPSQPPDLIAKDVSLLLGAGGTKVTEANTVDNLYIGHSEDAKNFAVDAYHQRTVYLDDIVVADGYVSDSGSPFSIQIPKQFITPGTHVLKLVLDRDGKVAESDETNNVVTKTITLKDIGSNDFYTFIFDAHEGAKGADGKLHKMVSEILSWERKPTGVIFGGDAVQAGYGLEGTANFQKLMSEAKRLEDSKVPTYFDPGNHERGSLNGGVYMPCFTSLSDVLENRLQNYRDAVGDRNLIGNPIIKPNYVIIGLDSGHEVFGTDGPDLSGLAESQILWLETFLKSPDAQGKQIIIVGHAPAYAGFAASGTMTNTDKYFELLKDKGVIELSGHRHKTKLSEKDGIKFYNTASLVDSSAYRNVNIYYNGEGGWNFIVEQPHTLGKTIRAKTSCPVELFLYDKTGKIEPDTESITKLDDNGSFMTEISADYRTGLEIRAVGTKYANSKSRFDIDIRLNDGDDNTDATGASLEEKINKGDVYKFDVDEIIAGENASKFMIKKASAREAAAKADWMPAGIGAGAAIAAAAVAAGAVKYRKIKRSKPQAEPQFIPEEKISWGNGAEAKADAPEFIPDGSVTWGRNTEPVPAEGDTQEEKR